MEPDEALASAMLVYALPILLVSDFALAFYALSAFLISSLVSDVLRPGISSVEHPYIFALAIFLAYYFGHVPEAVALSLVYAALILSKSLEDPDRLRGFLRGLAALFPALAVIGYPFPEIDTIIENALGDVGSAFLLASSAVAFSLATGTPLGFAILAAIFVAGFAYSNVLFLIAPPVRLILRGLRPIGPRRASAIGSAFAVLSAVLLRNPVPLLYVPMFALARREVYIFREPGEPGLAPEVLLLILGALFGGFAGFLVVAAASVVAALRSRPSGELALPLAFYGYVASLRPSAPAISVFFVPLSLGISLALAFGSLSLGRSAALLAARDACKLRRMFPAVIPLAYALFVFRADLGLLLISALSGIRYDSRLDRAIRDHSGSLDLGDRLRPRLFRRLPLERHPHA